MHNAKRALGLALQEREGETLGVGGKEVPGQRVLADGESWQPKCAVRTAAGCGDPTVNKQGSPVRCLGHAA